MSRQARDPISGSWCTVAGAGGSDTNFEGSLAEWEALSPAEKARYETVDIDNDYNAMPIEDALDPSSIYPVQNQAIANPIEAMVNLYGSKNLLPTEASSQVLEGITYTVNSDGTIDVNGSTSSNWSVLHTTTFLLPKGTYKFWNDGDTNCYLFGRANNASGAIVFDGSTSSDTFTLSSDTTIYAGIAVRNYVIVYNKTVYPMIRDARIADDTYVPYAMTNQELTDKIRNNTLLDCKSAITAGSATAVLAKATMTDGIIHGILLFFKITNGVSANTELLTLPSNMMSMEDLYSFRDFSSTYSLQRTADRKLKAATSISSGTIGCFIPY